MKRHLLNYFFAYFFLVFALNANAQYIGGANKAAVIELGKTNKSDFNFQDTNVRLTITADGIAELRINSNTTKFKYVGLSSKGNPKYENVDNKNSWFILTGNELVLQSRDTNEAIYIVLTAASNSPTQVASSANKVAESNASRPSANNSTTDTNMGGFQHKNKVWTNDRNSNCDTRSHVKAWVLESQGRLVLNELSEDVITKRSVSEFKQSGNQFLIKYADDNSTEIYQFNGDIFPNFNKKVGGIQMIEQVVNGEVKVKNGLNIQRNQFTPTYRECESGTAAANAIANPPPQVKAPTWRWPNLKFEKVSYCAGVLNYATGTSDNPVGKKMSRDLQQKAVATAKRGGISEDNFINLAERGQSDALEIYKYAFERDMKRGMLDPTQTARNEMRYAVQECQNTMR